MPINLQERPEDQRIEHVAPTSETFSRRAAYQSQC